MAKLSLTDISNLQNEATAVAAINANNTSVEDAFENTLSRDGSTPNSMLSDLDMNSNSILNLGTLDMNGNRITDLGAPVDGSDAARLSDLGDVPTYVTQAQGYATAAASSASSAASHDASAATHETNAAAHETNAAAYAALAADTVGDSYVWLTDTSATDPTSGKIKVNNATLASVTEIYISETDSDSNNIGPWIAAWANSTSTNKAVLTIEKTTAPSSAWAMYYVTGVTDNGTWDTITATYVTGAGSFSASDAITVSASLIGNKGQDGAGTGDMVSNTSTSVVGEVTLFADTSGKLFKRATGSGLAKLTSGVLSTASSGTDYAPATSGSSILKGNGSGGFSNAVSATDYAPATSGSSILKGNGSGGFSSAVSSTDYAPATSGSGILKGNGSGGFSTATAGTDYVDKATTSTITAGYTITSSSIGTVTGSNQTITPNIATRGFQHCTLDGSSLTGTLTFAAPSNGPGVVCVEVVNGGTGAVGATLSTSGYTKVTGDSYATTNGNKYLFWGTKSNSYSHLHIQALQ